MRIGPTIQFCRRDKPRTRRLRNTPCSSSYFTFVKGGYIITIKPTAMGTDVVPTLQRLRNGTTRGTSHPKPTPATIAAKIQAVRWRSRKLRRLLACIVLLPSNVVHLLLQRQTLQTRQRGGKKQSNAPIECDECRPKRA